MDKTKYMTAPFAKVNKTEDNGREVWGFATLERVDKSGEIADFNGTVKAFEKWSNEISKQTGGKNLGNVRLMHQPIQVGKTVHWEPTETTINENGTDKTVKAIWVGAYIPPTKPDVIKDIDEGILSAFSIGGSYQKRWYDSADKAFRFIPELSEYSLVDNPCVEGATIKEVINKAHGPWEKDNRNLKKGGSELKKEAEGSYEDLRDDLRDAINAKYNISGNDNDCCICDNGFYIAATFPDKVIVCFYGTGKYMSIPYTYNESPDSSAGDGDSDEDDEITLGDPVEVEYVEQYVPKKTIKYIQSQIEKINVASSLEPQNKDNKEVEKMDEEAIKKAAESVGLDFEKLKTFFKTIDNNAQGNTTQSVQTISGDGKGESPADIGGAQSTVTQSEKDTGITKAELDELEKAVIDLKTEYETLEKSGKAISDKNKAHLTHAINHVKAALEGGDYTDADLSIDNSNVGDGPNSGMESPEAVAECDKFTKDDLSKAVGDEVNKSVNKIEALFKGVATLESLDKLKEKFEDVLKINEKIDNMEKMVKEIHETPQAGGPVLNGGISNMQKFNAGETEEDVLKKMINDTSDPMMKDRFGQELAIRMAKNRYK